MFNKTFITPIVERPVPYTQTIIEKKAPTDESIKLYEEIREKCFNSIISSGQIENCALDVRYYIEDNFYIGEKICRFITKVNDETIRDEFPINSAVTEPIKIQEMIFERLGKFIAHKVLTTKG